MNATAELTRTILDFTTAIQVNFPECAKNFKKMPDQIFGEDSDEAHFKNLKAHYQSIVALVETFSKTHALASTSHSTEKNDFLGNPFYPASEDIYNRGKKETALDPMDFSKNKTPNHENAETSNEKGFEADRSDRELDVPRSELDDQQERIGSEDEENNYYSLGGDNHKDLEEDRS